MTLTLKYFIHQVFILCLLEVIFVFFAIFGLGKVLWFCLTKVSGKNQSSTNLSWFIKICKLVPKVVKKKPKWQDTQKSKNQKITKYFRIGKVSNFKCKKVFLVILKIALVELLIVLIETLLYCIFCMYVNCVLTEHLAECKRCKSFKSKSTKSSSSSFFEFTFLYLPNVFIHEPNEFIHVRVVKQTIQIQIHNSEVD